MSYKIRNDKYKKIEELLDAKVMAYILSDNQQFSTRIANDVIPYFADLLDDIGYQERIVLILYTTGGDTLAARNIVNLISEYCNELIIIVPFKAQSAGTLMCLRANRIYMNKRSILGPIDPSVITPFNPALNVPGVPVQQQIPVSVESIRAYFDYAREQLDISDGGLGEILINLSKIEKPIHPLLIGQALRSIDQIKMLAKQLLIKAKFDYQHLDSTVSFLCSNSGSHDYTISYSEATDDLHLPVKLLEGELKTVVDDLLNDYASELNLFSNVDWNDKMKSKTTLDHEQIGVFIESTINYRFEFLFQVKLISGIVPGTVPPMTNININVTGTKWKRIENE